MQDEEQRRIRNKQMLHNRLEAVSPELLSEFLFKRGIPIVKCLMCGSEDIGIPQRQVMSVNSVGAENSTHVQYIKIDRDGPPFSFANYEYRLICRNCGFTMNFAVWPVIKWVEDKLALEGSDGDD